MSDKNFVWMPSHWRVWDTATRLGVELIPDSVISIKYTDVAPAEYNQKPYEKRIGICSYLDFPNSFLAGDGKTFQKRYNNLNWLDCLIVHCTEHTAHWWPVIYADLCMAANTDKIVCIFDGYQDYTNPPPDRFFCNMRSWFHWVAEVNEYKEISVKTHPNRPYVFDALMGTARVGRVPLLYNLLDSDLLEKTLINFQPNPHYNPWPEISQRYPEQYKKWGELQRYSSPELINFDHPVITEFKQTTQDKSAHEQYLANTLTHNGNHTTVGNIIAWDIYANSWYSIVCETCDVGFQNLFLSEKTAKCLFAKRIFLMHGGGKLLKYLQSFGFKTFHGPYIDESYDNEPDDAERSDMVWEQIQRLAQYDPHQVYAYYQPVLDHNFEVFQELPKKQMLELQNFLHNAIWNT